MLGISDLGQSLLSGGLLDTVSKFVGGNPDATKKTFGAALPASMYAIADHGSTELGARSLLDGLRNGETPELDINDLGRTLGDTRASDRLMASSGGFLERLLGGRTSGLLDGLSSFGGVGRSASSKVMALAAPLAMGLIGRRAREGNLDARGLSSFLRDQKASVASMVPAPLRSVLGMPSTVEHEVVSRREVRPAYVKTEHKRSWWPFVLAGLAALAALIWFMGRPSRRDVEPRASAPAPAATPPIVERQPAAPEPEVLPEERQPVAGVKKPTLQTHDAAVLEISEYFAGPDTTAKRVTLSGIIFASGSSRIDPEGARIADDLASLMKANPNAKARIEGYADAKGDAAANKKLAKARADELERQLVQKGVEDERIETATFGEERPLAPDQTAAGRSENRRVEIVIIKR